MPLTTKSLVNSIKLFSLYSYGHRQIPSRTANPGFIFDDAHCHPPGRTGRPSTITSRTVGFLHPRAHHQAPARPRISSTKDMRLLTDFNKKYVGHPDYDPTAASLGKSFYAAISGSLPLAMTPAPMTHLKNGPLCHAHCCGCPSGAPAPTTPSTKTLVSRRHTSSC